jgi:hypothetical protein
MTKSRRMRLAGYVHGWGEDRDKVLVGNSKAKGPLKRRRGKWRDNIKTDLKETV